MNLSDRKRPSKIASEVVVFKFQGNLKVKNRGKGKGKKPLKQIQGQVRPKIVVLKLEERSCSEAELENNR